MTLATLSPTDTRAAIDAGALEQVEAEQRLGVAQRLGDGRLRHVERTRGGGDGAVDVHGMEDFDMAQVHRQGPTADAITLPPAP